VSGFGVIGGGNIAACPKRQRHGGGRMKIEQSVLLPYAVEGMFDLIERAEAYPQFIPWCTGATILERSDDWVAARLEFNYLRLRFDFATRNPKQRPTWLQVCLVDGPFKQFQGTWTLTPLSDIGCRVAFVLSYELNARLLEFATQPVIARVGRAMVDAFVRRAEATLTELAPAQRAAPPTGQAMAPAELPASAPWAPATLPTREGDHDEPRH
jgi:ribosome-associated toxin RatA of RatAB toxin-antitoxin module